MVVLSRIDRRNTYIVTNLKITLLAIWRERSRLYGHSLQLQPPGVQSNLIIEYTNSKFQRISLQKQLSALIDAIPIVIIQAFLLNKAHIATRLYRKSVSVRRSSLGLTAEFDKLTNLILLKFDRFSRSSGAELRLNADTST